MPARTCSGCSSSKASSRPTARPISRTLSSWLSGSGPVQVAPQRPAPANLPQASDRMSKFVRVVLADTEDVWTAVFKAGGTRYEPPKLVLFRGSVRSACGQASAAVGPFTGARSPW